LIRFLIDLGAKNNKTPLLFLLIERTIDEHYKERLGDPGLTDFFSFHVRVALLNLPEP